MIAGETRDTILAALRAAGIDWTSARDLATAVYGCDAPDELHAVYVTISRARRAGVLIETGPMAGRNGPRGYRLAGGEDIRGPL